MFTYIARRFLLMIPTFFIISILVFIIIELPPGDVVTIRLTQMKRTHVTQETIENLRHIYSLDKPIYVRYFIWISRFVKGDFGYSLYWSKPVKELILNRFALTALISLLSLLFTWVVSFPIAIYSATHQYSLADFFWTFIGFLGLAIPNFLLALVLMVFSYKYFPNLGVGGLFSQQFQGAPWSWGKFLNLLGHLWVPIVVIGTAGTCGLIRIVRANLLDELRKVYVQTARAKGVSEAKLILKYPVRMAINPFLSTVGWVLPSLIAGETITAIVLGLPTAGPLFLQALMAQDMQLAGAFVMLCAILTIIGTLISDILLGIMDPRIRYE